MSPLSRRSLMPHPTFGPAKRKGHIGARLYRAALPLVLIFVVGTGVFFSIPSILTFELSKKQAVTPLPNGAFPVSVNPIAKTITENPDIEAYLTKEQTTLEASVAQAHWAFTWLATEIASLPLYKQVASVAGNDTVFVTIYPGYRQEEVAQAFGSKLDWNSKTRAEFLTEAKTPPALMEGQFAPGTYAVSALATPTDVHMLIYDQFMEDIGERYSSSTAQIVPVADALTIASMLEREAAGSEDIRIISGIMWNRLFINMNLQIDATLQYAKGTASKTSWWPTVVPKDKYIKSPYNTYAHAGLPPGPIASPSVAAVLAALNPKKTDCLFYFHDAHGVFHCSADYKEHVALLKKYYGQGK